jgi:chemotaxis protein methyltransferase CheR
MKEVQWNDATFTAILHLLGARTGLAFRADQRDSTKQGIERAMALSKITDASEFARLLEFDVQALDDLIVELTVGETYFFREPAQFEFIRSHIVPEILQRRGSRHTVHIWSAACASGEEPYSLAILCHREGLVQQCSIRATDISSEALGKAEQATYRDWSLRARDRISADEYLHREGEFYRLDEQIRRMVHFEFLNLALDVYPSFATGTKELDLILCRNVLIYFDPDTIRAVARRLFDSLSVGGWLITASGDPSLVDYAAFDPVVTDHGVFYRRPVETLPTIPLPRPTTPKAVTKPAAVSKAAPIKSNALPKGSTRNETLALTEQLKEAEHALSRGEYQLAADLSKERFDDPVACVVHLKALANIDTKRAVGFCGKLTERHSLVPEVHYLHAVLLLELNLDVEAVQAAERALFLDRSLAVAHLLLGSILRRRGALKSAQRAFRNARKLCKERPVDERLPLADDQTAGQLAEAAGIQLAAIEAALRSTL